VINKADKNASRKVRHQRLRKRASGTPERPRFNVFRSLKHLHVQIIDDTSGHTMLSASTLDPDIKGKIGELTKKEAANLVGRIAAERALNQGIKKVVFDRGGYIYHGRVQEVANGAREAGLEF
jgi:large subunit ribosomal protein L18